MSLSSLAPLVLGRHRIDVPIVLAPMSGVSESPFRLIALRMGAGLAPTELVSSKGLTYQNTRTQAYLRRDPLRERPFMVQLFGGDPPSMAEAAEIAVAAGADIIDLNMGCPVKKVTRAGAGSALMLDPERAQAIVRGIRDRVGDGTPVTAKIRSGWSQPEAPEFGRRLEDAGVAAIAIHARTRRQGYSGRADWGLIARLVESVRVPVIANGDIADLSDAERVVRETGCAGVMVGRAALGNPWVFRNLHAGWAGESAPGKPSPQERAALIREHLLAHLDHVGDVSRAVRKFRQHLLWYSRGLRGGSTFRERAMRVDTLEGTLELIEAFFGAADEVCSKEAPIYDERAALG